MTRTNLMMATFAAAGIAFAGGVQAQATSKDTRDMALKSAAAQYKVEKSACDALSGNTKDICIQEAKGKENVAKADAEASFKNTPKARETARVARADATYAVSKEKCDDMAGNSKVVCVKEAKAALTRAKADAKVDRVASDTRKDSAEKTAAARQDAMNDKRDADYKVAVEKCDALAGTVKDACVRDAKNRFGKS